MTLAEDGSKVLSGSSPEVPAAQRDAVVHLLEAVPTRGKAAATRRMAGQIREALRPAALDASLNAAADVEEQRRQVTQHWGQRVERAQHEADRVARQYYVCKPENRLVARTLERRWDEALQAVRQLEDEFDRFRRARPRTLGEADRGAIRRLAEEVPAVWRAPTTTPADRRQVARLLIDRVVLTVAPGDDRVAVRVGWAGGAVREHECRRDVSGYRRQRD